MTYYIYHISGIKIGCTTELEFRMRAQGFTEWEILWQQEGDWDFGWIAGDKELELQEQYGYEIDKTHYQVVREKFTMSGKQHKEETKSKMSIAHAGKVVSSRYPSPASFSFHYRQTDKNLGCLFVLLISKL